MRRLVVMGVRLIMVAFVSQSALLVGTRLMSTGEVQDPLARYEAIMPGQPVENLEQYLCNWYSEYLREGRIAVCQTNFDDEIVDSVNVSINEDSIESLGFPVSGFTIGDLAQLWGRPMIGTYRGSYSARWDRGVYVVTVPLSRRFSYRLPVRYFFVEGDQASTL